MKPRAATSDVVLFAGEPRRLPRFVSFTHMARHTTDRGSRRCHGRWGLDYHFDPAGEFSLDGKTWRPREAHTAHLYAAGRAYWERSSEADLPFRETYIIFAVEDAREIEELVAAGRGFARFADSEGRLGAQFSRLLRSGGSHAWRGQAALLDILDLLLGAKHLGGADFAVVTEDAPAPKGLVDRVEALILGRYDQPLTLADMARAAGVSVSTLTHRYRTETGRAPGARLIEHRLSVARGMLLKGTSLKAIAAHTGFCDEFHLSKTFKQHFGMPPRRYARQHAGGSG